MKIILIIFFLCLVSCSTNKNAVMYDLQNGKQNVVCFCDNTYTAQGIVEGLNLIDNLEADGAELYQLDKDKNNE